jgi:hypothetical protein
MPRSLLSEFDRIQRDARRLLLDLREDIQTKDAELRRLKADESRLSLLVGSVASATARPGRRRGGRINWRALLAKLPNEFKAANVSSLPGLKDRRSSEIFAGITRWIDAGLVRRKSRGLYVRVERTRAANVKTRA